MAIDPKLVSIIPASQLPTGDPTNAADFLFYEGNALKKGSMSNIYDKVTSGIKGVATQTNAPTAYTPEAYPDGLFERYLVHEAGTYTNFSGIVVTAADLDVVNGVANNRVILEVNNGVTTKIVERVKGDVGNTFEPSYLDNALKDFIKSEPIYLTPDSLSNSVIQNDGTLFAESSARYSRVENTDGYFTMIFEGYKASVGASVVDNYASVLAEKYDGSFEVVLNAQNYEVNAKGRFELNIPDNTKTIHVSWSVYGTAAGKPLNLTFFTKGGEENAVINYIDNKKETTYRDITYYSNPIFTDGVSISAYPNSKFGSIGVLNDGIGELEYEFYGDSVSIFGAKVNNSGIAEIYIDGVFEQTVDLYSATGIDTVIYSKTFEKEDSHTIKIKATTNRNIAASDCKVYIYYFYSQKNAFSTLKEVQNFGVNALDYGLKNDGIFDNTAALNNLLKSLAETSKLLNGKVGGTIYFPKGVYRIDGNILVFKNFQCPIVLTGEGMFSTGKDSLYSPGGTIFNFYSTSQNPKFYTKGNGNLQISGITFLVDGAASNSPIFKTMNTRIHLQNCAFIGNKKRQYCDIDAIVLGGEVENESTDITDNGGFQGYGTVIRDCHFNNVRRALYAKTFANAFVFADNTMWRNCGSNLVNGAAIEVDAVDPNGVQETAGGKISGNLIEMEGYRYAIKLEKAMLFVLDNNMIYDLSPYVQGIYYLGEKSKLNKILPGFTPVNGEGLSMVKIVKDVSIAKSNRIIWGERITGDIDSFPL